MRKVRKPIFKVHFPFRRGRHRLLCFSPYEILFRRADGSVRLLQADHRLCGTLCQGLFKCCQIVSGGPSSGILLSAFVYVHTRNSRDRKSCTIKARFSGHRYSGKTLIRTSTPNTQNGDEDVLLRYVAAADSVPKNLKLRHRPRPPGYVTVLGLSFVSSM